MSHPSGFRPASRACPAVYLQPNHWWHRLDVWAPLTVIPAYHKPHCCQRQGNRQVDILQWWTMEMDKTEGLDRKSKCVCVFVVYCKDRQILGLFTPPQLNVNQHKIRIIKIIRIDWAALTSLNSWIWACSNMENTLELAPSAVLFFAFLGAFWHKEQSWCTKYRLVWVKLKAEIGQKILKFYKMLLYFQQYHNADFMLRMLKYARIKK